MFLVSSRSSIGQIWTIEFFESGNTYVIPSCDKVQYMNTINRFILEKHWNLLQIQCKNNRKLRENIIKKFNRKEGPTVILISKMWLRIYGRIHHLNRIQILKELKISKFTSNCTKRSQNDALQSSNGSRVETARPISSFALR